MTFPRRVIGSAPRSRLRPASRAYGSRLVAAGTGLLFAATMAFAQSPTVTIPRAQPAVAGNRAPDQIVFSADGSRAYVTETAEADVAVIDARAGTVIDHWSTGGERPVGLSLTPDGSELLVANSYSGNVAVLNARTGARRTLIPLPGMPWGVAAQPGGKRAFVSLSQLDEVAVIDLPAGNVSKRIPVGRRPEALKVSPDGKTLTVANLSGGSLSIINTAALVEDARVKLKGVNVRGVAVTARGNEAYATVMPAFNGKPTDDPREIWHNLIQAVTLDGKESAVGEDQWLDFARLRGTTELFGTPDQHDIVVDRAARYAWVAVSGRDVVTRITIHDPNRNAIWPFSQIETVVGANPRGLALTPDGKQLWVSNHLGNSISVLDADGMNLVRTIELGKASTVDPTILGQYLFNNAGLTRANRFTCNSCHPDGASDGLTWSFVHVPDHVERRNSRDLRASIRDTAPFRWSGYDAHLADFIRDEVRGLLGGPMPAPPEEAALEAAVSGFRLPPNPHRTADGQLTVLAKQGKVLFDGKAGCGSCHAGPKAGGTGLKAWIGTTPEDRQLDVPHLEGVYDSAPYLHDGRAATLEEVFAKYNPARRHGNAHLLSPQELAALLRYLREL